MSEKPEGEIDRVMIDIETLGLTAGSAILSIGAVRFDESDVWDEFYQEISLESCQEAGLTIDAGTLEWWLDQDDSVAEVLTGGKRLGNVLGKLVLYYGDADEVWANSPAFDCELIEEACRTVDTRAPWGYSEKRDVRTVRNLPGVGDVDVEMEGEQHHALDDAKWQARVVGKALRELQTEAEQ